MNPFFVTDFSISDSLKTVRKSVLIYETIILATDNLLDILKFRRTSKKLKNFLINEVNFELQQIASQYPNYQEFLTKNKDKLENRYKNSKKLR